MFRFNVVIRNRWPFAVLALLLIGVFVFPHFQNDWLLEMFLVMIIFPLLLALGAGATVSGRMRSFCVFTGRLSYPLYMTHIWLVWLFGNYMAKQKPEPLELYLVAAGVFVASMLMGYAALRWYDEPVRKWLMQRSGKLYRSKLQEDPAKKLAETKS